MSDVPRGEKVRTWYFHVLRGGTSLNGAPEVPVWPHANPSPEKDWSLSGPGRALGLSQPLGAQDLAALPDALVHESAGLIVQLNKCADKKQMFFRGQVF